MYSNKEQIMSEKNEKKIARLNQVVAIEKGVNSRATAEISEVYRMVQKPVLFNGFNKSYKPVDEDGEKYPDESQKVQMNTTDLLQRAKEAKVELFDTVAQKDYANMSATADVVVDGKVLVKQAPVPYLLFLEKQLTDIRTFVGALPVLDPNEDWALDAGNGIYKSKAVTTHRTKKVTKPLVLFPATDKHPAQTQVITEDVVVGFWEQVKMSGAMEERAQKALLKKVESLLDAVKQAREEANNSDAPKVDVGGELLGYIFG